MPRLWQKATRNAAKSLNFPEKANGWEKITSILQAGGLREIPAEWKNHKVH